MSLVFLLFTLVNVFFWGGVLDDARHTAVAMPSRDGDVKTCIALSGYGWRMLPRTDKCISHVPSNRVYVAAPSHPIADSPSGWPGTLYNSRSPPPAPHVPYRSGRCAKPWREWTAWRPWTTTWRDESSQVQDKAMPIFCEWPVQKRRLLLVSA
eukprot:scaffold12886_cov107-Isochrysis_galbana.AAC.2